MKKQILKLTILMLTIVLPQLAHAQISATHDSNKPIEITADSLEVMQTEKQAVFSGNVVAVQGDMKITSDKMTVFYRAEEDQEKKQGDSQSVSKIIVVGNVLLSTTSESAKSKKGTYNVDENLITLESDVVLTRGESVVKGEFLKYDLVTGKSQIVGSGAAPDSNASSDQGGKKGRVRGLFVPENK